MTDMSRVPLVLAFREKSDSEFTLDSSDFSVPSTRRWWPALTFAVRLRMKTVILSQALPRSFRNFDTVFLDRATPGCSSERKLFS